MMKKSLVALAVMAASGAAMAQSSVTIFGVVDIAATYESASGAGHRTGLSSGGTGGSRLGFRGTEDLGGGYAASFWLEGQLQPDIGAGANGGALNFARRSTVSLSNNTYGELRLGRDFVPTWWNLAMFDPFQARGAATVQAFNNFGYNSVYNSNTIGYVLPGNLGGVYGQFQYAFGEKASTSANDKQGNSTSGRLGYQKGPFNAAAAYTVFKQVIGGSDTAPVSIGRDLKVGNAFATWDFGVVKPVILYGQEKVPGAAAGNSRIDSYLVGATAPLGTGELRFALSHYDVKDSSNDFNKVAFGYGYFLSKRTQLYAAYGRLTNKGSGVRSISVESLATVVPTTPGGSSSAIDIGIRHNF
jgi:predicted porin